MDIFEVLLSNAVVVFVTAPLRRIRFLITVEDDLVEEGVLPAGGFGGVRGCVRFLYTAGGRSITIFYRGALLEAGLGFVKYGLQRVIAIPISRRLHLDMRRAFLVTTLLHTTLTYVTVTPVQTAVDTIVVNGVTDFTPVPQKAAHDDAEAAASSSLTAGASSPLATAAAAAAGAGAAAPPPVKPRFAGSWATTRFLAQHFPVLSMVSRLYLLEFGCRYASSLVNNKILGYLVRFVEHHRPDGELTNFQRLVMYAGCPLLASLAVNLLTYPIATYPLAHFLRLRYYERRAAAEQQQDEEAERDYPPSHAHGTATTSSGSTAAASSQRTQSEQQEPQQSKAQGSASSSAARGAGTGSTTSRAAARPVKRRSCTTCTSEERFWFEDLLCRVLHSDVQLYLWTSMYGYPGPTVAASVSPAATPAPTARSSMAAASSPLSAAPAAGGAEGKRGLAKLYRGYGLVVASTLLSAGLAMAVNTVTSRVVAEVMHH